MLIAVGVLLLTGVWHTLVGDLQERNHELRAVGLT